MRTMLWRGVADLFPGYFALVMATGIVSNAAYLLGMGAVPWVLFRINQVAYGILWLLTLARLIWFFPRVVADLTDHTRGPGFFTVVAGTCVMGSQLVLLAGDYNAAILLWSTGVVLWVTLIYTFFTAMTVRATKPTLENGLNGGWLIAVVATQSVSLLGTMVAPRFAEWEAVLLFFTVSMYLLGGMLYGLIMALIFYRLTFFSLTPSALTPPYWINMGAIAITTLAGAELISAAPRWTFLQEVQPFLKGLTLFFWAVATWWIPLLCILGAWRHVHRRFPIRYDPQYWGLVFPLGMYTACTFQMARAMELEFLYVVPKYFIYAALLAWLVTFVGLIHRLVSWLLVVPLATHPSHK